MTSRTKRISTATQHRDIFSPLIPLQRCNLGRCPPEKATLHPDEVFVEKPKGDGECDGGGCVEVAVRIQEALSRRRACEALLAYRCDSAHHGWSVRIVPESGDGAATHQRH